MSTLTYTRKKKKITAKLYGQWLIILSIGLMKRTACQLSKNKNLTHTFGHSFTAQLAEQFENLLRDIPTL